MVIFRIFSPWRLNWLSAKENKSTPPLLPTILQMFILRTQWALLAILLNKLIAILHQADFFFLLKRVDYYYREQQIIICGPNLKTSISFRRCKQKSSLLLWVGRKVAPGHLGSKWRTKHKTRLVDQLIPGSSTGLQPLFTLCDFD